MNKTLTIIGLWAAIIGTTCNCGWAYILVFRETCPSALECLFCGALGAWNVSSLIRFVKDE